MKQIKDRRRSVIRINVKDAGYWLLLVFLTLPHMKPAYLARIPVVDLIFDVLRGASFLIIVFWFVVKRKPISIVIVLAAVWRVVLVYSTFVHKGEVYNCLVTSFSILSVMLLFDAAYNSERTTFISAELFCFEVMVYINLYTVLAYPGGLYTEPPEYHKGWWFLGLYNTYTQYFVPAMMFAWLYKYRTGKRVRAYLLMSVIVVTVFTVWSGGEITIVCITFLVYIFFKNRTKIFNYYSYWILHIVFFVTVFVFRLQNLFQWFIGGFLGKWSSLTGRMHVWDRTFELFLKYPIIGHGMQDQIRVRRVETGVIWGAHAHNLILELLYQGGIVGIALWCVLVVVAGRRIYRYNYTAESKIIATAFLGWCVATLVEPYVGPFLMGMFVIAYRSNRSERTENVGEHLPEVVR